MILERYVEQLTQELELMDQPPQDENKYFHFQVSPGLVIDIRELDPGLFFFSKLSSYPKEKKEEILSLLMQANFLGQGTGGATIGLEENEKYLTLSSALPYDMNYRSFKEALNDFANYVDYWREEIENLQRND